MFKQNSKLKAQKAMNPEIDVFEGHKVSYLIELLENYGTDTKYNKQLEKYVYYKEFMGKPMRMLKEWSTLTSEEKKPFEDFRVARKYLALNVDKFSKDADYVLHFRSKQGFAMSHYPIDKSEELENYLRSDKCPKYYEALTRSFKNEKEEEDDELLKIPMNAIGYYHYKKYVVDQGLDSPHGLTGPPCPSFHKNGELKEVEGYVSW